MPETNRKNCVDPTVFPMQTKHKQPDARQCKHKCSTADSKPRTLYCMPWATTPAAKKLPEFRSEAICKNQAMQKTPKNSQPMNKRP